MKNTVLRIAVVGLLMGALSAMSSAQTRNLRVDSDHSEARFSTDVTMNRATQTINLGAAKVAGFVSLDKTDITKSILAFNLYPAASGSQRESEGGRLSRREEGTFANNTNINFQSEHISLVGDNKLQVSGKLSVTFAERKAVLTPSEAYAGAVSGPLILHTVTREASFQIAFPDLSNAEAQSSQEIEISATTLLNHEAFAPFFAVILSTNWPPVVQDEKCSMSSTVGEDYAGASCTGKEVESRSLPVNYPGIGEDYPGFNAASLPPNKDLAISVHMKLIREQLQLSAKADK